MGTEKLAVIIDDEPDVCKYIASILQDHGYRTMSAYEAATGEELVKEHAPDLVCMDIMMPGRSGVQLLSRLKGSEATRDIPLVMVTGIREKMNIDWNEIARGLKRRRPDAVVEKPVEPVKLMRAVERATEG